MLKISESSNFLNASDSLFPANKVEELLSCICQNSPFKMGQYQMDLSISPHFTLLTGTLMPSLSKANSIERWLFEEILPIAEGFSEKENTKAKKLIEVDSLIEKIGVQNTFILLCRGCDLSYRLTKKGNEKEKQYSQNAFHLFGEELKIFTQRYKNIPAVTDDLRFSRNPSVDAFIHALEQKQFNHRNLWIGAVLTALASIAAAFKYTSITSPQPNLIADNHLSQRIQPLPFDLPQELTQNIPLEPIDGFSASFFPKGLPQFSNSALLAMGMGGIGGAIAFWASSKKNPHSHSQKTDKEIRMEIMDCIPEKLKPWTETLPILESYTPEQRAFIKENKNSLSQICAADFKTLLMCLQGLSLKETKELYQHISDFSYWGIHDTLETKPPQERLQIVRLINSLCLDIGWDQLTSPDNRVSRFSLLEVISKIPYPQREIFMGFIIRSPHPNLVKDLRELNSIFNSYLEPIDESMAAEIIELAKSYGLGNPAQSIEECNKIFQLCRNQICDYKKWKVKNRERFKESQLDRVIKQAKALKITRAFKKKSWFEFLDQKGWFEFLDVLVELPQEKMTRLNKMASKEHYDLPHAFGFLCDQGFFGVKSEGISDIIIDICKENEQDSFRSLIETLMKVDPSQRKAVSNLALPFIKKLDTSQSCCELLKSIDAIVPQQREHVVTCAKDILGDKKFYNIKECLLLLNELNNISSENERLDITKRIQQLNIADDELECRPWNLLFSTLKDIPVEKRDRLIEDLILCTIIKDIEDYCEHLKILKTVVDEDKRKQIMNFFLEIKKNIYSVFDEAFPILANYTPEQETFITKNKASLSQISPQHFIGLLKCLQGLSIEEMEELYPHVVYDIRVAAMLMSVPPQERLEIVNQVHLMISEIILHGSNNISSEDLSSCRLSLLRILSNLSCETRKSFVAYIPQLKKNEVFKDLMNCIKFLGELHPLEEIILLFIHYRPESSLLSCTTIVKCILRIININIAWILNKRNKDKYHDNERLNKVTEQAKALKIIYSTFDDKSWIGLLEFLLSLSPEKADLFVQKFNSRFENGCNISIFKQFEQFENDQRDIVLNIVFSFLNADLSDLLKLLETMIEIDSKDRIEVLTDVLNFVDLSNDSISELIHFISLFADINQSLRKQVIELAKIKEVKRPNSNIKQCIVFFEMSVASITWVAAMKNEIDKSELKQVVELFFQLPLDSALGEIEKNREDYHRLFKALTTIPKEQRADLIKQLNDTFKDSCALDFISKLIEMLCLIDQEQIRSDILQSLKGLLKQDSFGVRASQELYDLILGIKFIGKANNFAMIKPLLDLAQKGNYTIDFTQKDSGFYFGWILTNLSQIPETEREVLIEDINHFVDQNPHFVGQHPISCKKYSSLFNTICKIRKDRKELLSLVLSVLPLCKCRNLTEDQTILQIEDEAALLKIFKALKQITDLEKQKELIENVKFFFPLENVDQGDIHLLQWTIEILKLFSHEERKGECKILLQEILSHLTKNFISAIKNSEDTTDLEISNHYSMIKFISNVKEMVETTAPEHRMTILKLFKDPAFYKILNTNDPIEILITLFRANPEVSMDSADYLKVYFDKIINQTIEKGKITTKLRNLIRTLSKFNTATNERLYNLSEYAEDIQSAFENSKETNPIRIFHGLKEERQHKEREIIQEFSTFPSQIICGKSIFLNLNTFRERGFSKKITFGDLPANIGTQTLHELFLEFENRFQCNEPSETEQKRQEIVKIIEEIKTLTLGSTFAQLKEVLHRSEILRLLNLRGKPDQPIEAAAYYLHMIIKAISEANNERVGPSLSQRERMLVGFAYYIKNCSPRQRKQMKDYYEELPLEYRLKTKKTIDSIQEKIEYFVDLAIQSCLNELLSSRDFHVAVTNPEWDGDIYQLTLYLQNRLFWPLGLNHELTPDVYTGVLPIKAVETDLQTLMEKVSDHLTPQKVILHLTKLLRKSFKEKDTLINDLRTLKENNIKLRNQINLTLQELNFEEKLEILKNKKQTLLNQSQKPQDKTIDSSAQTLAISNIGENFTQSQWQEIQKIKKATHQIEKAQNLINQQEDLIKTETEDQKKERYSKIETLKKSLETLDIEEAEWENSKGQGLLSIPEVSEYLTRKSITNIQDCFDYDVEMDEIGGISDEGALHLLLFVGYLQET